MHCKVVALSLHTTASDSICLYSPTAQDAAFSRLASGELPDTTPESVPTMMGVTNLYFLRVSGLDVG